MVLLHTPGGGGGAEIVWSKDSCNIRIEQERACWIKIVILLYTHRTGESVLDQDF